MTGKIDYECPDCGSNELSFYGAVVRWDTHQQRFEMDDFISEEFEMVCHGCGATDGMAIVREDIS